MPTASLPGSGGLIDATNTSTKSLDHEERRPVRQVWRGQRAIDIDLERGDVGVEMRLLRRMSDRPCR